MSLEKRAYERRIYQVDVAPVMRPDDTISALTSVVATGPSGAGVITINSTGFSGSIVTFRAEGGDAGKQYTITIRFTTEGTPDQALEGTIPLDVAEA